MTDTPEDSAEAPPKKSKMPLILSLVLALVGGGGGFYLSWSGLIMGDEPETDVAETDGPARIGDFVYVPIDPLVISLRKPAQSKHLRFRAQMEVPSKYVADVEKLLPRVTDVLNGYLRAVKVEDLESPAILVRLRSQMLHRIEVVVGPDRVKDLLIMEFVFT